MSRCTQCLLLAIALFSFLALAPGGWAQSTDSGSTQDPQIENMLKDPNLKLTDEQKNQLKSINEQRRQQIQAIQQDGSLTREQKMQKIREVNQGTNQQIRNTLTPEQYQRWQRRQRDRREDVRDRREDRRDQREDRRDRKEDRRDKRRKP